jgi:hypothetical protein
VGNDASALSSNSTRLIAMALPAWAHACKSTKANSNSQQRRTGRFVNSQMNFLEFIFDFRVTATSKRF